MADSDNGVKARWLSLVRQHRAIAIVRARTLEQGIAMAKAAAAGGFRLLEVTWTNNANPADMTAAIRQALPHCTVGAGSVLTQEDLGRAIAAQAQFCFTPHTDASLIQQATQQEIPMIAGAMTPTEIICAWRTGAASVKVFPIAVLGNADYIRSLQGPLGPIPLIPTGGVTSETAPALIGAGAIAVGLSSALFPKTEVQREDWGAIEARSRYLLTRLSN